MGMRQTNDPYGGCTPAIDKLLGSAYEDIKKVADNLDKVRYFTELMDQFADPIEGQLAKIDAHIAETDNPHNVTAAQIGAFPGTGGNFSGTITAPGVSTLLALRLRSLAGLVAGAEISLQGYHAKSDGGQGTFVWNPDSTRDDDAGLVIKPNDVNGAGRWIRHLPSAFYNVKFWGAKGDGVTDDTSAIQRAINAAGILGGRIIVPAGTYFLTSTLFWKRGVEMEGVTQNTIFYRISDYGDTIVAGAPDFDIRAGSIKGIFFTHGTMYTPGDTVLDWRVFQQSAHVRVFGGQNFFIDRCIFWRLPFGVIFDHSVLGRVNQCFFMQVWDPEDTDLQEGVAGLAFLTGIGNNQLMNVSQNYFTGPVSPVRSKVFADGMGGAKAVNQLGNVGSQHGILIHGCEDINIFANYFGRHAVSNLRCAIQPAPALAADLKIYGNFFDNAGGPGASGQIICNSTDNVYVMSMTITGNVFNGEYDTLNAINIAPSTNNFISVTNLSVTGNSFIAHVASPLLLSGVGLGIVSANTISNYNSLNVASPVGNQSFSSAGVIGGVSYKVFLAGNVIGGGGNSGSDDPVYNFCHYGFTVLSAQLASCVQSGNFSAGVTTSFAAQQVAGPLEPTMDNVFTLGSGSKRFPTIYLANAPIVTSGEAEKEDIEPLTDTGILFDMVDTFSYRMKDGGKGKKGKRLHWGFKAGQIKAASDAIGKDWGAYIKTPEGREMLRSDEILPAVWSQIKDLRARIAELESLKPNSKKRKN